MIPSMGNKVAHKDFLSRPRKGVFVHLDLNDFGSINKQHGHPVGDQAIVASGNAIRSAMNEAVGKKNGKLFRIGGDEFVAHVPSHEHAAQFLRNLRGQLDSIPAIRGTHRLSTSAGIGHTPEHAEQALMQAKGAKKAMGYLPGQAKTHAASMIPGKEGVIPVE
jgi:diguanylate cyclase (GGDEF)-like protein